MAIVTAETRFLTATARVRAYLAASGATGAVAAAPETTEGSVVVDTLLTATWAEVVIRHFARQTNLLLSSSRVLVVGSGPLAAALTSRLGLMSASVSVASDSAVELLPFFISGHSVLVGGSLVVGADIDVVIATGESHRPVAPRAFERAVARPIVLVDAGMPAAASAVDRAAFAESSVLGARDDILGFGGDREVFLVTVSETDDPAFERERLDVTTASSLMVGAVGVADADRTLAEVLLS